MKLTQSDLIYGAVAFTITPTAPVVKIFLKDALSSIFYHVFMIDSTQVEMSVNGSQFRCWGWSLCFRMLSLFELFYISDVDAEMALF